MVPRQVLEDFERGTLELNCPKMELRQEGADLPTVYRGSGSIRLLAERQLNFTLVASEAPPVPDVFKELLVGTCLKPGKIVPDTSYYSLSSTDIFGLEWKSTRIMIKPHLGAGGVCISGKCSLLEHTEPAEESKASLILKIVSDVEIPCNTVTATKVTVGQREYKASALNAAEFTVSGLTFSLTRDQGIITVSLTSNDSPLRPYIETRIIEALQFVTARSVSWDVMQKVNDTSAVTCLCSGTSGPSEHLSPPINFNTRDLKGVHTWSLFDKYLQHILIFRTDDRFKMHPLSAWLNYVRAGSTGSVFAKGLALGVAIEGVLEAEFSCHGRPSEDHERAIKEAKSYMTEWTGDDSVKKRAIGAIDAMLYPRAKDRLLVLEQEGTIRRDDVKAWDAIRHRAAHARPPEKDEVQKWIDNCFRAEVLLYNLIFRVIGYEGKFTDYGASDWPEAKYPLAH